MTKIEAAPAHRKARPSRRASAPLLRVRRIGYVLLGVQLVCFLTWSTLLYQRFALSFDFAVYHQPWYLIAHGDLDPYSSVARLPFWRNDAEFAIWPLAPLYWLWPHNVVLLWVQDVAVVMAEGVAFTWLCELAQRYRPGRDASWLAALGIVLLVANPWIWWAVSFDFHEESLAIPFAVLLARDVAAGRRRMWAWVLPILAAGAPTATYVVGIGLGGLLAGRRSRRAAGLMVLLGVSYSLLVVFFHADAGAPLVRHYGYLVAARPAPASMTTAELAKGIATHPLVLFQAMWDKRVDILANLAPSGFLGIGFPVVLPLTLVVLLANTLSMGYRFAEPIFQALPIYILVPVGTVGVLAWIRRRNRRVALLMTGIVVVQVVGWLAVWGSRTADQWLRVPASTAATLAQVEHRIPDTAEVVASQGVIGRFSGRRYVHELAGPGTKPVQSGDVWFVVTPMAGSELQTTADAMTLIGDLAGNLHARLVTHANGVWAFDWHPPPGQLTVDIPARTAVLPAWASPGGAGSSDLAGPVANWHAGSTGARGYVTDGLAWQKPVSRYQVSVRLSATGPVNVEVWDDTGNALLARRSVPATDGVTSVTLPVTATAYRARAYAGWGPFRADFVLPPGGQRLEVRVWSPGGEMVNVYSASLTQK